MRCALIPPLLLAAGLSACSLSDPDFLPGPSRNDLLSGPREETPDGREERHLWISAVEYPEGYDWKRDTARGQVACRLVLFRDGSRVLELPVREGVSPDMDMHRIAGGHLYTDDVIGDETVLSCDGKEIFRYKGRETIRGFMAGSGGEIHTLGQNRSGAGFTYRIDGKIIHEEPTGILFGEPGSGDFRSGAFCGDKGISFSFSTTGGHVCLWQDGSPEEIQLQEPQTVFDLRPVGGRPVTVYSSRSSPLRLAVGDNDYTPNSLRAVKARILPLGGESFRLFVRYRLTNGEDIDALVESNGKVRQYKGGGYRTEAVADGESYVSSDREGRVAAICWKGEIDSPEAGRWTLMGPQCIWMDDENAWVGLTGQPPDCPALWNKGEMTTLLMNGYLTGVVYE